MKQFNENEVILTCGRTPERGNWVAAKFGTITVRLEDDNAKPIPQIKLKDKCIEILKEMCEK